MIHHSPLPDVEIPAVALTGYVLARAGELGDKPALIDGPTGRTLTYTQLEQAIRALAGGLVAHGLRPGDVVALMAPNLPEYAVIFHGVALAGGVVTTVNPTYTAREVRQQLLDAEARLLVTIAAFVPVALAAVEGTAVEELYLIGSTDSGSEGAGDGSEATVPIKALTTLFGAPLADQVPVDPDDLVVLPYSSGTTGVNKGVMLSHHNLVANIAQVTAPAGLAEDETLIAVLPFFHIYGMQVIMNCGLRVGATVVTMPRFDLEQFLDLHQRYGVTRSFVAPPIVVALAKHPIVDSYDLSALRQVFSGAAPLSAELAVEAGSRLGCEVVQGYGMTEMSPVSHLTPLGGLKAGSVGVTAPNTELRIVDPATLQDLPVDADGELWIRGPQVMRGYLKNADATALTVDSQGWLRTGDIGHVDADGHVFVVDRLKELIKYKGFQVAPAELEAVLLTHPAVADAAVIGVPDEDAGEVPSAFVVLRPGASATGDDIESYVAGQVASFKQIRHVSFVDSIPKSASGKILRRLLRENGA
ncbi:MAG: 4-coumarate--CoA ligase family protein [Kineosporiaceae bacterium]